MDLPHRDIHSERLRRIANEAVNIVTSMATGFTIGLSSFAHGFYTTAEHANHVVEQLESHDGPAAVIENERAYSEKARDDAMRTGVISFACGGIAASGFAVVLRRRRPSSRPSQ